MGGAGHRGAGGERGNGILGGNVYGHRERERHLEQLGSVPLHVYAAGWERADRGAREHAGSDGSVGQGGGDDPGEPQREFAARIRGDFGEQWVAGGAARDGGRSVELAGGGGGGGGAVLGEAGARGEHVYELYVGGQRHMDAAEQLLADDGDERLHWAGADQSHDQQPQHNDV